MQSDSNLRETLRSIDHKSYPAYKSLRGSYRFADYVLSIDHVQGDPFAAPSHVRVTVDAKAAAFSGICHEKYTDAHSTGR